MRLASSATSITLHSAASMHAHAPLAAGTVLGGRYRIVTALASGSMGAVYQAEDMRLSGRPRALKEMLQTAGTQQERSEAEMWFRREGETLMSLQHPAIPLVHDTFSDGQRHYLVMDLVDGRSLEQVVVEEGRPGLEEKRVVGWAEQVLEVLSYLHSRSDPLIFRDLKPANLMLTPQGQIRLIDFGIARVFTRQAQGTAIGTPGYAPPEQYQGLAEPASDLYALGATMHHLLTGRDPRKNRPFDFPPVRTIAPIVSAPVANAIDRSLSLDPRARPGTAAEMRRAIRASSTQDTMPKLSISGSLARSHTGSGAMPALASRGALPAGIDPADGAALQVGARGIRLQPHEMTISYAGSAILTKIDRRTIRIKNRTNKRILCSFDSDVPWLRPDRPAAWLDPHDRLDLTVGVTWSNPPAGNHHGVVRVHGGGNTWSVPVSLQVNRLGSVMLDRLIVPLAGLAMLCFSFGVIAMVASYALGLHVDVMAWDLIVVGLVGRVLLRLLRAGMGR
ncbi:MAG: protein kinase [Chloroflexi bacterium]|jgi:serine/threonine protein kinase|nr:protein kinase [Chloroflexota bacterium]